MLRCWWRWGGELTAGPRGAALTPADTEGSAGGLVEALVPGPPSSPPRLDGDAAEVAAPRRLETEAGAEPEEVGQAGEGTGAAQKRH